MADIPVNAGGNLQTAMNGASGGDTITLEAGASFANVYLPAASSQITVRSSAMASIPNARITMASAGYCATIGPDISGDRLGSIRSDASGRNWKFEGINIAPTANGDYNTVYLDRAQNVLFDRCIIIGITQNIGGGIFGSQRGFGGGGANITVQRCHVANIIRSDLADTAAVGFWNGSGPYLVDDNYLEAGGQNVFFGGGNPSTLADRPANIIVRNNYCFKPDAWYPDAYTTKWVKNQFELKTGRHVHVHHNVFSGAWPSGQDGTAILMQPCNDSFDQDDIQDVCFEDNVVDRADGGISLLGRWWQDLAGVTGVTGNITIKRNQLFCWGRMMRVSGECGPVTVTQNVMSGAYSNPAIYLTHEGNVMDEVRGYRAAEYACSNFVFAGNDTTGVIGANVIGGESGLMGTAALTAQCLSYSLDMPPATGTILRRKRGRR